MGPPTHLQAHEEMWIPTMGTYTGIACWAPTGVAPEHEVLGGECISYLLRDPVNE